MTLAPSSQKGFYRILIVDDTDFDREKIIRALKADSSAHYDCMELSQGESLERLAMEWKPDLVILDFALPFLNGLEILRRLKVTHRELPFSVVVVTGTGDEATAVEAMKLGATHYVPKMSLTPVHIREIVSRALRETALQRVVLRQRQEILESEWRLRQLADAMPQMVWIANSQGKIEYVNRRWSEYTGTTLEQILECPRGGKQIHPDDLKIATQAWNGALAAGEAFTSEYRIQRVSDASYRWHLIFCNPVRDASTGQVLQWYGTSTDIHDAKLLRIALEESVHARDDFLSIASHELKTPLTSLKLKAQLMTRQLERGLIQTLITPEALKKQNNQTIRDVEKLIRLVDDMLDMARIRAGKLAFELEALDFSELIGEVFDRMAPLMEEAGTPLELECVERIHGRWDGFRIEQVLVNLLTNAMRYGKQKPVKLSVQKWSGQVRVQIKDQGIGIEALARERIFHQFERVSTTQKVKGLGLGLFISKQILEAHQGTIHVESDGMGAGSTFTVMLPLYPE